MSDLLAGSETRATENARTLLSRAICDVYGRFARKALRPEDIVHNIPPSAMAFRHWMTDLHGKGDPSHQPDAVVFSRFRRDIGTILDIGAHWGYTASAIRRFGSDCPILSVEASRWNTECLDEFRRLDGNYDFVLTALGEAPAEKKLYCPTVNGTAITGLNCVDGLIFDDHHASHIVSLVGSYIPIAESYQFQLLETPMPMQRLDDLLASATFQVPAYPIAAMKLDVERFEAPVLRGATDTLRRYLPFIMIEGANRDQEVRETLQGFGYLYADRDGAQLRVTDATSSADNGYWLHPNNVGRYKTMGLLPE